MHLPVPGCIPKYNAQPSTWGPDEAILKDIGCSFMQKASIMKCQAKMLRWMPEPSHTGKCSWHWCDLIIQVENCGFGVHFKAIRLGLLSQIWETFSTLFSKRRPTVISTLESTLESIFAFKTKAKHSHCSSWTHQSHEVISMSWRQRYKCSRGSYEHTLQWD